MAVDPSLSVLLLGAFDDFRQLLGSPTIYAFPWQTPPGLSYDADLDTWVTPAGGAPDPDLYTLYYTEVPALWGADAEGLALTMGGVVRTGDLVAIARAGYEPALAGAFMVRTGVADGEKYNIAGLENAPDGGGAVFVVARLRRRE